MPRRPGADSDAESEKDETGGGAMKTDRELERLLERAEQFAAEKRYDLAVVLWQKVLDGSGEGVMLRDEERNPYKPEEYSGYRTIADRIERTIAALPLEALKTYRLTADGEAQALLTAGQTGERDKVLARIVRRFFLSSSGDDAAFELACLQLDRHEFVGASWLLTKILTRYPDSDVPRDRVLLRLVVASARLGDFATAGAALAELKRMPENPTLRRVLALIEQDVERSRTASVAKPRPSEDWHMVYGNPTRRGFMKQLPPSATAATLSELWTRKYDVRLPSMPNTSMNTAMWRGGFIRGPVFVPAFGGVVPQHASSGTLVNTGNLLERWKNEGWSPAGQLLIDDGRVYFKNDSRLVCCDAETGEEIWLGRPNQFQLDPRSLAYAALTRSRAFAAGRPRSAAEVFLFGDRVQQSMAIAEGLILNVEGRLLLGSVSDPQTDLQTSTSNVLSGAASRRVRQNWLSAYDAANGKLKWYRSAAENEEESKLGVGFLAAPVPYGNLLIVPVTGNGEVSLLAIKLGSEHDNYKHGGETVWKTYLCDEPEGGCSPWSPVGIAVDGGDVYVATGAGTVITVNAMSGDIRWALCYRRSGKPNLNLVRHFRSGTSSMLNFDGWDEDVVIPCGRQLIVMASDFSHLFALDRRTGEFEWDSPRITGDEDPPAQYCLGVVGKGLFVAGKNVVRRYDIPSGRLLWDKEIEDSFGRGALTTDSIYLPVKDSVLRLDLESGKELGQVGVVSPTREPAGNLFSDGKRLLAIGLSRVYALTDLDRRLVELTAAIEEGDGEAQFQRMRLRNRMGKKEEAIDDLRKGLTLLLKQKGPAESARALYAGMNELSLAEPHPQLSLELLAIADEAARNSPAEVKEAVEELASQRFSLLFTALRTIEQKRIEGAAAAVLRVVPLFRNERRLTAANAAMAATARKEDAATLRAALKSPDANVRLVATSGLRPAFGDESTALLKQLLTDDADGVRLAAALSLANRGDRAALPVLGRLLESDDLRIRARSAQALRSSTGQRYNFAAYADAEPRAKAVAQWQAWIAGSGKTAKLTYPLRMTGIVLGRTLITNQSRNQVTEIDSNGVVTWQASVSGCFGCQGLPNGHRLISSYRSRMVVEYDESGREVWKATLSVGQPFAVQRLENGNTLVACYDTSKVIELKQDRSIAWEVSVAGRPYDARRLENGNTLVCLLSGNRVVEVDRTGRVVWQVANISQPRSARRLENGHTLICQAGRGQVVEVDKSGQEVWRKDGLSSPADAQRLENGNTLIADSRGIQEVKPDGTSTSVRRESGVGRMSRF